MSAAINSVPPREIRMQHCILPSWLHAALAGRLPMRHHHSNFGSEMFLASRMARYFDEIRGGCQSLPQRDGFGPILQVNVRPD
jgi:hypothetical protein